MVTLLPLLDRFRTAFALVVVVVVVALINVSVAAPPNNGGGGFGGGNSKPFVKSIVSDVTSTTCSTTGTSVVKEESRSKKSAIVYFDPAAQFFGMEFLGTLLPEIHTIPFALHSCFKMRVICALHSLCEQGRCFLLDRMGTVLLVLLLFRLGCSEYLINNSIHRIYQLQCVFVLVGTYYGMVNPWGFFGYDEEIGGIFDGMSFIGFITVVTFHLFICVIVVRGATATEAECGPDNVPSLSLLFVCRRLLICVTSDYDDGCAGWQCSCGSCCCS